MEYYLLFRGTRIDLTRDEFGRIAAAKDNVVVALTVEEKFLSVLENYVEFDAELYVLARRRGVIGLEDWDEFQDDIYTINRRLSNLLSSGKLYIDHVHGDLMRTFGRTSQAVKVFDDERERQQRERFGFKAIEQLRNYLQHRSFAVDELAYPMRRENLTRRSNFLIGIEPRLRDVGLANDRSVDRTVVAAVKASGGSMPITHWVMEYVEGLTTIHRAVQTAIDPDVREWESTLEDVLSRMKNAVAGGNVPDVRVICTQPERVFDVFPELMRRRRRHRVRSIFPANLSKHIVTTRSVKEKPRRKRRKP